MSVSINTNSGAGAIPSSDEMNSFSQGLKNQSTDSLIKQLGSSSTPNWEKDAISKELQSRAQNSDSSDGTDGADGTGGADGSDGSNSSDEAAELLKKLQNGTISQEELQKLSQMLGVDVSQLEAIKGQGSGSSSGTSDITGG